MAPFLWSVSSLAAPLEETLAQTAALGGPSGHCPHPGQPDRTGLGTYGTAWYPVGFSPSGAFASLSYEDNDASPRWVLTVQSLVDDKPLAALSWDDPEGARPSLESVLAGDRERITSTLQSYGIVASLLQPSAFPLVLPDGASILASQEEKALDDNPSVEIQTWLRRGDQQKRIDRRAARSSSVIGYLRSPYEERLAVLLVVRTWGFEGTTDCRIHATGAHIQTGFSSP